jgi:hypothetical protein
MASTAPVMALAPSQGRDEWHGDPLTVAITQCDHQAGAAEHRHVGSHAEMLHRAHDGVVLAGFAGKAAGEDELAGQLHPAGDNGLHRMQHGSEIGFLLACAFTHDALAGQPVFRSVDDIARIRIWHRRGRLIHGVADEHQRLAAVRLAIGRDQVPHRIVADIGKAHGAQTRRHRVGDEFLQERLVFEKLGLRAGHSHQLDQKLFCALARNAPVQKLFDIGGFHRSILRSAARSRCLPRPPADR